LHPASSGLLVADDPTPVVVENPGGYSPILLLGDHAGRAVPARLGDLGVPAAEMDRHIAWDVGVAGLGALLARRLDAVFIRQAYSRLVIDCNRDPGHVGSIVAESDGCPVPANLDLSPQDRAQRIEEIFAPYQAAIAAELDARAARSQPTLILALHSFTPRMNGFDRPWRFGVLHGHDSAFSRAMLAVLRAAFGEAVVGDNQPYALDRNGGDFTVPHHADPRGLDYLELEVRQDQIGDEEEQEAMARTLAPLLSRAARTADLGD
jgi:predicted N-formylglutamate amidohydrolase